MMKDLALLLTLMAAAAQAQRTMVILGSSTSAGTGASTYDSSYAGRYAQYLASLKGGWKLVNLAVGGYTTYHLMPTGNQAPAGRPKPDTAKNLTKALSLKPEVLLLALGSNDIGGNYAAAEYEANYDSIRAIAMRAGVRTWVSTCMPRSVQDSAGRLKILALRSRIMQRYAPRAVDFYDSLGMPDGRFHPAFNSGDGIHTNNRGHMLLFKRVVAADFVTVPTALAAADGSPIGFPGSRRAFLQRGDGMAVLTARRIGTSIRVDLQGRQRSGSYPSAMP